AAPSRSPLHLPDVLPIASELNRENRNLGLFPTLIQRPPANRSRRDNWYIAHHIGKLLQRINTRTRIPHNLPPYNYAAIFSRHCRDRKSTRLNSSHVKLSY